MQKGHGARHWAVEAKDGRALQEKNNDGRDFHLYSYIKIYIIK
jgi:hypothetical protein